MYSKVLGCRLQAAVSPIVLLLFASPPSPSLPLPCLLLLLLSLLLLLLLLLLLHKTPVLQCSTQPPRPDLPSGHQDYRSYCNY